MSGWIDAHCHLADLRLAGELAGVIERSRAAGVTAWWQGGVGPDDWERQRALASEYGDAFVPAFGLHPWWVGEHSDDEVECALEQLAGEFGEAPLVGELGLDFHPRRLGGSRERQQRAFRWQLDYARAVDKPIVLHVVRAHRQVIDTLAEVGAPARGGLVHSFAGSADIGREYIELGLHLSVSGGRLHRPEQLAALAELPRDRIVVETDAPDQRLRALGRGANEPSHLPAIADTVGRCFGESGAAVLDRSAAALSAVLEPS